MLARERARPPLLPAGQTFRKESETRRNNGNQIYYLKEAFEVQEVVSGEQGSVSKRNPIVLDRKKSPSNLFSNNLQLLPGARLNITSHFSYSLFPRSMFPCLSSFTVHALACKLASDQNNRINRSKQPIDRYHPNAVEQKQPIILLPSFISLLSLFFYFFIRPVSSQLSLSLVNRL